MSATATCSGQSRHAQTFMHIRTDIHAYPTCTPAVLQYFHADSACATYIVILVRYTGTVYLRLIVALPPHDRHVFNTGTVYSRLILALPPHDTFSTRVRFTNASFLPCPHATDTFSTRVRFTYASFALPPHDRHVFKNAPPVVHGERRPAHSARTDARTAANGATVSGTN